MNELLNDFKVDLEKLINEWYDSLEHLVDGALFNMSFLEGDIDEHFVALQGMMIEVLQERLAGILNEEGESH